MQTMLFKSGLWLVLHYGSEESFTRLNGKFAWTLGEMCQNNKYLILGQLDSQGFMYLHETNEKHESSQGEKKR